MKPIILQVLILVCAVACNTPYYSSANNMSGQPATLNLNSGKQLQGKISVRSFDNYSSVSRVQFAEGTDKNYQEYSLSDIQSVYLNGGTYCVKKLIGSNFWSGNALRFVQQLTPPGGRIDLFQHEKMVKNSTTGKDEKQVEYYLQLPGAVNNEIFNLESGKFTPNFDDKMSAYVKDCPALAAKIKSKDKDYFYPFVVNNGDLRRKAVLLQIIHDYNTCKQ
ncbi:hypothetical protein [Ferruginibacter sp. HRS2-29]|uniref:hypothetical protein n=1 Tax=Ferruginibacter sp. HRS2-29 TaxID=2487334 RepID=UPI0020CEA007|nr:hypothetical protein [Ferruginibacter sp. HRS2-29]MCP9753525.1 hypothetical protein [Ferruginibacter sp. HRS2-29]